MPPTQDSNPSQYVCDHGHAYYDGDQGVGSPYGDGLHDRGFHVYDEAVRDWEPWEQGAYRQGFEDGAA